MTEKVRIMNRFDNEFLNDGLAFTSYFENEIVRKFQKLAADQDVHLVKGSIREGFRKPLGWIETPYGPALRPLDMYPDAKPANMTMIGWEALTA